MALERLVSEKDRAWGLWKITEIHSNDRLPGTISNPIKQLEWLAGRILTARLMTALNLTYAGIRKDDHGKPFPIAYALQLSLSHSYPYVAALIDRLAPAGIDVEQPKDKLLRIAHRVLDPSEHEDAGNDIEKHCIYWCAKEALIKIYGKKDLILSKNLIIKPFSKQKEGELIGRIIVDDTDRVIPLQYAIHPDFVLVLNK
jgi:4'-phosphopantetheinyl transferase